MKNLKKLIYQYNFLKLELDEMKEEHTQLVSEFESLFSDYIPPNDMTEEEMVKDAKLKAEKDVKPKKKVSESTKKVYKNVAKKLHPDIGGDDTSFKELNNRYKEDDLLGVVTIAVENGIDFEISDEDMIQLKASIDDIEGKIKHYETTLAYVWKYGNQLQKYSVIATLGEHFGKPINVDSLPDEIKKQLGKN
jgi:hypothetical protein